MPLFPIVDSHIHLFPSTHLSTLAWWTPDSPLNGQHSVSEYEHAVSHSQAAHSLRGFIFIETDRISSTSPENWTHVKQELSFLLRIMNGRPIEGEGHNASDKNLCLGIVPWAPVPAGREVMNMYLQMVFNSTGSMWGKVKGFRYLVQDKKPGTMTTKEFGEGLDLLGEKGLVFDLGINVRQAGLWQLEEALAMISGILGRSGGKEEKMVTIAINHMCKPDMRTPVGGVLGSTHNSIQFLQWREGIQNLAKYPKAYMKLSGGFSELPLQSPENPWGPRQVVDRMKPFADVVFEAFGPRRIMFGSDWPVCNVGGAGNQNAWTNWQASIKLLLEEMDLSDEDKSAVWSGTAATAYNIND